MAPANVSAWPRSRNSSTYFMTVNPMNPIAQQ
jgi:hypothetical protein